MNPPRASSWVRRVGDVPEQHYGSGPVLDAYAGLYQRLAPRAQ